MFEAFIFLLFITGMLFIFELNPFDEIAKMIKGSVEKPVTMRTMHEDALGEKRRNIFTRYVFQAKQMLELTGKINKFDYYCKLSAILTIIGFALGVICSNVLLVIILSITGALIPVLLIQLSTSRYQKQLNEEYETALSSIDSSYMRTENLLFSVNENIEFINSPVKELFEQFIVQASFDMEKALVFMRDSVNNDIFKEWCDAMLQCQRDHTMKNMLDPIITKLTDTSSTQKELDTILYKPIQMSTLLMIIALLSLPMLYFLNYSWFLTLFNTFQGQIGLACLAGAELLSLIRVIRVIRPI